MKYRPHSRRLSVSTLLLPLVVIAFALPSLTGCVIGPWNQGGDGTGGDDDDSLSADDDDATGDDDTGDDDDTSSANTASYPAQESWYALAVGNVWRYDEEVVGDVESKSDDVLVTITARIAGEEMDPPQSPAMVVFKFEVDRLFGVNESHWYGLDGSGPLRWVKTSVSADLLGATDYPGDGSLVATYASTEAALIGAEYQALWFYGDIGGHDYSATVASDETFFYGNGAEVETLGNQAFEDLSDIGIQYVKPGWGLLGQQLTFGSNEVTWTITECSACPTSSGL
jgi:hypothetical protein